MRKIPKLQLLASAVTIAAALTFTGCSVLTLPRRTSVTSRKSTASARKTAVSAFTSRSRCQGSYSLRMASLTLESSSPAYRFEGGMTYIPAKGGSGIQRAYSSIVRRSDGKQLGEEAVKYSISSGQLICKRALS